MTSDIIINYSKFIIYHFHISYIQTSKKIKLNILNSKFLIIEGSDINSFFFIFKDNSEVKIEKTNFVLNGQVSTFFKIMNKTTLFLNLIGFSSSQKISNFIIIQDFSLLSIKQFKLEKNIIQKFILIINSIVNCHNISLYLNHSKFELINSKNGKIRVKFFTAFNLKEELTKNLFHLEKKYH